MIRPNPAADSLMRVFDGFPPQVRRAITARDGFIDQLTVFDYLSVYGPEKTIEKINAGGFEK